MIDLAPRYLQMVKILVKNYLPNHEIRLFGSRVRGTAKPFSDIDLVIMNKQPLSRQAIANLVLALEDSDLPYKVDILQWSDLSDEFKELISSDYAVIQHQSF